jgi:PPOX class probable F420-dependent enzyme
MSEPILSPPVRRFIAEAREAVLATRGTDGLPRLVPICFVLAHAADAIGRPVIHTPIDEKSKSTTDPHQLQRVKDLLVLPDATLLVDRWDEDWSKLAWVRLYGRGEILEPEPREVEEHRGAIAALRAKYAQYRDHRLEDRPIIRITVDSVRSWGAIE